MRIIKMKKTILTLALLAATGTSQAELSDGAILNIGEGSFFTMGGGIAVNAPGFDGQFITGNQGLALGSIQEASGSHSGAPNGSENSKIDNPWLFFGNTGMNGSLSPTNVLSASGNTATVDFSGWSIVWNGLDSASGVAPILMGTGAWFGSTTNGVAQVTCSVDCSDGDTYTLIYSATIPSNEPSSFGNTQFLLNLTGTISDTAIPRISISVNDDNKVQECAATGGHDVMIASNVQLLFGAVLDRIEWELDGQIVAEGDNFSEFLSLGSHGIKATAFTVGGQQETAFATINIVDTTAPEISAAFIDQRSGEEITVVNKKRKSFIAVSMSATDTCDASPSIDGMGGFQLFDGDALKIKGHKNKIKLTASELEMEVKAIDASGNSSVVSKSLSITP
jgi:hypothetical protein